MNYVLIYAAGVGERFGSDIPKQFVEVNGKPLLGHVLDSFEQHSQIDAVLCVCAEDKQNTIWDYTEKFGIKKLKWLVVGGETGHDSINNGITFLRNICQPKDRIILVGGNRPLIDHDVITELLEEIKDGEAIVLGEKLPLSVMKVDDNNYASHNYGRASLYMMHAPVSGYFSVFEQAYLQWVNMKKKQVSCVQEFLFELGVPLYVKLNKRSNLKVTFEEDISLVQFFMDKKLYQG